MHNQTRDAKTRALDPEIRARLTSTVVEYAAEATAIVDSEVRICWVNKAFELITGYHDGEAVGHPVSLLRSGMHDEGFYNAILQALQQNGRWSGEIWRRRRNGEAFLAILSITAVRDEATGTDYYVDFFNDLTFIQDDRKRLEDLINHDALTGLPNRRLLWDRLETAVQRARRNEAVIAVLFIDLDRFKDLNDSLGHLAGDRVLCTITQSFLKRLREVDTLARVGGDEFVLIMEDLISPHDFSWVEPLVEEAEQQTDIPATLRVQASVGYALYPRDGHDAESLYAAADEAMYRNKNERGCIGEGNHNSWGRRRTESY